MQYWASTAGASLLRVENRDCPQRPRHRSVCQHHCYPVTVKMLKGPVPTSLGIGSQANTEHKQSGNLLKLATHVSELACKALQLLGERLVYI